MILRIQSEKLSDAVISRIKQYVLDNGLRPGDRLPTEAELADSFGVSRNVVREAVKALNFLGIIDSAPRRGLTLAEVDMGRAAEYLGFHFALSQYPKTQLLDARTALEVGALPNAMRRLAKDGRLCEQFTKLTDELAAADDVDVAMQKDMAFHRALLEASGIEPLVAFGELLQVFFKRYREDFLAARPNWQKGVEQHRQIIAALRAGKPAEAETILRNHLEYNADRE